jgi:hypothetical protein
MVNKLLKEPFLFLPGLRFKTYDPNVVPPIKLVIVQEKAKSGFNVLFIKKEGIATVHSCQSFLYRPRQCCSVSDWMVKTVLLACKNAVVAADLTWHVHIVRLAGAAATKINLLLAGATLSHSFPQQRQILGGG